MSDKLFAYTDLYILLKILIGLVLSYFLDPESHLFGWAFDQIKKCLYIQITHYFNIQDLIE